MAAKRPNVLFICTDQQRYDALGCYGNTRIQTPAIDRLAADGVLFEQCYVQSPVCAPSRASLVTGQYVHNHGLWANGVTLPEDAPVFSKALADSGYDCGLIGKMHLSHCFAGRTEPRRDDGYRLYQWAHDPTHRSPENAYHQWLRTHHPEAYALATDTGDRRNHEPGGFDTIPAEAHYSHWAAEEAIAFINDRPESQQPFFLWLNFFDPHHPFVAPQEYLDRYQPEALPPPIGGADELATKPPIQTEASRESYAGHARGYQTYDAPGIQQVVAAYYAMVSLIDDEVARVLAALAARGLAEDTVVIFTSDHGEMLGDHQLLLKGPMLYEGAVRVPLIMRWPGALPAGERRAALVEWLDLCPTILGLAGLAPLPGNQGLDLLPLARGDADAQARGWALCEYRNSGHAYDPPVHLTMLRHGPFKLIVQHGPPVTARPRTGELYNLQYDPNELRNLWDEPEAQADRIALERMLLDVLVATEDRSQPRPAHW